MHNWDWALHRQQVLICHKTKPTILNQETTLLFKEKFNVYSKRDVSNRYQNVVKELFVANLKKNLPVDFETALQVSRHLGRTRNMCL